MNKIRTKLGDEAMEQLKAMVGQLKSEFDFLKISTHELNTWIIKKFKEKYFEVEKRFISKDFFCTKDYLKSVLDQLDETKGIQEVLKIMKEDLTIPGKSKVKDSID